MIVKKLMDVLEAFVNSDDDMSERIVEIENIFRSSLKCRDQLKVNRFVPDSESPIKPVDKEEMVQLTTFSMAWSIVIENITRGTNVNRLQALNTSMNLLKLQAKLNYYNDKSQFYFPAHMLKDILNQLLDSNINNSLLMVAFKKYSEYIDIVFNCWKVLPEITNAATPSETYMNNYFSLLNAVPLKKDKNKHEPSTDAPMIFCEVKGGGRFRFDSKKISKYMENTWNIMSAWNLQGSNLQKAILILIDHLIPHLPRPVLLTDFLMNSMDVGGTISALALQGVFLLMQRHNLEYPFVYTKLYNMYEPNLFFTKHKSRLLFLTDTFLSSTHLPEALVAAYVKRFARLALLVPSCDALVLLQMISNLIIRHPGLKVMLDAKKSAENDLTEDPYNMDEKDPYASGALQSSLWEVADLKHHVHPVVASAAAQTLVAHHATMEKPISEMLDDTEDELTEAEFDRQYKQVFLNCNKPSSIQDSTDDGLGLYWKLF